MKFHLSKFIVFIVFATMISCTPSKSVVKNCAINPVKLNIENINGNYKGTDLWSQFYPLKTKEKDTTQIKNQENTFTKIAFNGKDEISVSIFENEVKLNEIKLKAKVYKDYVSIKKRHKLIPLIPIYFESEVYKIMLFNNTENELTICGYSSHTLVIFIMSGGKDGYFSQTFEKI